MLARVVHAVKMAAPGDGGLSSPYPLLAPWRPEQPGLAEGLYPGAGGHPGGGLTGAVVIRHIPRVHLAKTIEAEILEPGGVR
jgi:hypothetical protein